MQQDRITIWRLAVIIIGLGLVFSNSYFDWDMPILLPVILSMVAVLLYLIKINK